MMRILVRVRPARPRSRIVGEENGILLVDLRSRPERGEANRELLELLQRRFGGRARIVRGHRSRRKLVEILDEPQGVVGDV